MMRSDALRIEYAATARTEAVEDFPSPDDLRAAMLSGRRNRTSKPSRI